MAQADSLNDAAGGRGVPTKCVACHQEMHGPAVCDYCHTLNPIHGPVDYFSLLGVPRRFRLDAENLRRRYLALNRHAHPDFHTDESPEVHDLALQVSSALNDAYRTLSDPVSRAEYLLELLGGRSSAQDRSVPDGFLNHIVLLREEIEDARASGDGETLAAMREQLGGRLDGMVRQLGELFGEFDATVACEGARLGELDRIRQHLNAISYVRRMLAQAGA